MKINVVGYRICKCIRFKNMVAEGKRILKALFIRVECCLILTRQFSFYRPLHSQRKWIAFLDKDRLSFPKTIFIIPLIDNTRRTAARLCRDGISIPTGAFRAKVEYSILWKCLSFVRQLIHIASSSVLVYSSCINPLNVISGISLFASEYSMSQ